jgi:hypothetical protein
LAGKAALAHGIWATAILTRLLSGFQNVSFHDLNESIQGAQLIAPSEPGAMNRAPTLVKLFGVHAAVRRLQTFIRQATVNGERDVYFTGIKIRLPVLRLERQSSS